jgi:hypothetical protein
MPMLQEIKDLQVFLHYAWVFLFLGSFFIFSNVLYMVVYTFQKKKAAITREIRWENLK